MKSNKEILSEAIDGLSNISEVMIYDINNFKRELERQGLMTNKLSDFIDDYMQWDNY